MTRHGARIDWDAIPWRDAAPGLKVKEIVAGDRRLRLVVFDAAYDRTDWCHKGHHGQVLSGRLTLMFDDGPVTLSAGDSLHIESGGAHRHQTHMAAGEEATLFLVEDAAA